MPAAYRFVSTWRFDEPPGRVFRALAEVDRYAVWWPQVRRLRRVTDDRGVAWVRSALPYTLRLVLTRQVHDQAVGRLRVRVDGDLVGWSEFRVSAGPGGTRAEFRQEVDLRRVSLRAASPLLRPVLVANHTWMLRCGERGLRRYLAGGNGPAAGHDGLGGTAR